MNYLYLAEGFEEVEALTVVDLLRRAQIDVQTVSITDEFEVTGAHGITVIADILIEDSEPEEADWLILPGGMPGAVNLHNCKELCKSLTDNALKGKNIAAICASPAVVLAPLGILTGKRATCYPGFESQAPDAEMTGEQVVALDNLITANGPASAMKFALAIIAAIKGQEAADSVAAGLLLSNLQKITWTS